jgi:hypothetical protein
MVAGGGGAGTPRVNVTRSLSDVIRDVQRIVEKGERALDELSAIALAVAEERPNPPPRPRRPAPPAGSAPVAETLRFEGMDKGRAVVSLGGAKRVALPPALAELVGVLASDDLPSPDEFVAWKSLDRLGELLEKRLARRFTRHNVSQLLSRLRKALKGADLDPRLIESSQPLGARLRLRRRQAGVCAG